MHQYYESLRRNYPSSIFTGIALKICSIWIILQTFVITNEFLEKATYGGLECNGTAKDDATKLKYLLITLIYNKNS